MEKDLVNVFTTDQPYQAEIARELLEENDIEAFILNQHDSMIPSIGTIEVFVHQDNLAKAEEILKKLKN